jgi:hypothetical protein
VGEGGRLARLSLAMWGLMLSSCVIGPTPRPSAPYQHLHVSPSAHSYHPHSSVGLPVSVAQIDTDQFLLADTVDVFRLSRTATAYTLSKLSRPTVTIWNPTGLAYRAGVVYVANNRGGDLLELRLQGDALNLVQRVTSPALRAPQNLVVQADGSLVAADTDGSGIERFAPNGSSQWRVQLDSAHGVTESGGFIYASSLAARTVAKIDLAGNLTQVAGSLGGTAGRYLWPVGLAGDGDGVMVTDALSGRITFLDRDLRVLRYVGANGPGLDAFNFPSATLPLAGGYLVTDTFKDRLVLVSRDWTIQEQIALGPLVPVGRLRPGLAVTDGRTYAYGQRPQVYMADGAANTSLPGVDVVAALRLRTPLSFAGAFSGLDHFGRDGLFIHLDFDGSQVQYSGLTWAQKVESVIAVGSPESSALQVIDPGSGMFTTVEVGLDTWWLAGRLMFPDNVPRDLSDVVRPALASFGTAEQLLARGVGRQQAFDQAMGRPRDWAADLTSGPAQQFWHSGMTRADASRYFDWALQQPHERVPELLDVKYLSAS